MPEYPRVKRVGHPNATTNGCVTVHTLVAEKILGKSLPKGTVIHHVDGDITSHKGNIVICQDHVYHMLLERRTRAYRACGHANWLKCQFCKEYGDPASGNMTLYKVGVTTVGRHKACWVKYLRKKRVGRIWIKEKERDKALVPTNTFGSRKIKIWTQLDE